jgi:hypothetical protein
VEPSFATPRNADLPPGIDAAIGRSDSGLSAKPVSPAGFYFFIHHDTQMRGAMRCQGFTDVLDADLSKYFDFAS